MPLPEARTIPVYRYLATRELLEQPELPGMERQVELPFPTMSMEKKRYKIFGIVTNRDLEGNELINWLHKRCGKSEEAHSIMKEDLAGGKLPSSCFGENAAWWWIMILAFNLNSAMKRLVLEGSWVATKDEGHPVLPDWAAGTSHEPCARAYRPAREESPLAGGIGESAAANYGAWLCTIRVGTDGLLKTRERHGCERSDKEDFIQNCPEERIQTRPA